MTQAQPLGVFATLTEGFSSLNKRLWLLLVPILLDLFLAFGPGVSFALLVDEANQLFPEPAVTETAASAESPELMLDRMKASNMLGLLAWQLPSLVATTAITPFPSLNETPAVEIAEPVTFMLFLVALMALGLLGASVYLSGIAESIKEKEIDSSVIFSAAVDGWLRYMKLVLLLLLFAVPFALVGALLTGVAGLLGDGAGALVGALVFTLALAAFFYLSFVDEAIFATYAKPMEAIWGSMLIIRTHFWSAVGLIVLIQVILMGMPLALRLVAEHPIGFFGAVALHAYVATGLAAGAMLFFRQRYLLYWHSQTQEEPPLATA